jgi:hypothetical protein
MHSASRGGTREMPCGSRAVLLPPTQVVADVLRLALQSTGEKYPGSSAGRTNSQPASQPVFNNIPPRAGGRSQVAGQWDVIGVQNGAFMGLNGPKKEKHIYSSAGYLEQHQRSKMIPMTTTSVKQPQNSRAIGSKIRPAKARSQPGTKHTTMRDNCVQWWDGREVSAVHR